MRGRSVRSALLLALLASGAARPADSVKATPTTAEPSVKWVYAVGVSINKSSPAIGPDGTVYVGNGGQYLPASPDLGLFAINPNGTLKWKYALGNYVFSPVIGDDGTVYVQDATSSLYAFTPAGRLKWKYALNTSLDNASRLGTMAPAIDADGTLYIGGDTVYAINPDGTRKWRYSPAVAVVQVRTAPAISADGTIYVAVTINMNPSGPDAQAGGVLWALNRDGTLRWQYALNSGFAASSPSVGADGTVYVGSDASIEGVGESFIYAFNPGGTVKWRDRVSGYSVRSSPSIAVDGTLYVGTRHNAEFGESADLLALNPDGTLKWTFNVPSHDLYPSPAIGADGMIYFGDDTGRLYAVHPDGTLAWTYLTNDGITETSPAIDSDGTLYFGNNSGNLYALRTTSGGLANSAWPKFHHDNRNTGFKNTPLSATPAAPRDLTSSTGVSTVSLVWSAPLSGSVPISYVIEAGSASGTSDLASLDTGTAETTFYATAVSPGTYYVRVKAKGAGGAGPPSNEVVVTLGSSCSLSAPTGLVASVAGATVRLSWTAPSSGTPATYVVEAGSGPGLTDIVASDLGSASTSLVAPNVARGTYYVRVRAKNACGISAPSNEVAFAIAGLTGLSTPVPQPSNGLAVGRRRGGR